MHLDIVARMGVMVAKANAYQNHGLMMAKMIAMMAQMKEVRALLCTVKSPWWLLSVGFKYKPGLNLSYT